MTRGPLRRSMGMVGLLTLVPLGVMLFDSRLSLEEAGYRAVVALGVVWSLGRVLGAVLQSAADHLDPRSRMRGRG